MLYVICTLESVFDDRWDCYKCQIKFKGSEKALEVTKKKKGCIEPLRLNYVKESFKIYKCLGNFVSKEIKAWIDSASMYEKGVLPYSGSLGDQPAKAIDLMTIILQLRNEKIQELREKENRKSKRR